MCRKYIIKSGLDKIRSVLVSCNSTLTGLEPRHIEAHTACLFAFKVLPQNKALGLIPSNFLEMLIPSCLYLMRDSALCGFFTCWYVK